MEFEQQRTLLRPLLFYESQPNPQAKQFACRAMVYTAV
jgi:hypothetical protein